MEIKTEITFSDYSDFSLLVIKEISEGKQLKLLNNIFSTFSGLLLLIVVIQTYAFYNIVDRGMFKQIDYATLALVLWFIVFILYSKWYKMVFIKKSISNEGGTLGKNELIFTKENIIEKHKYCVSTISWSGVMKAVELNDVIYIFLDISRAIIIPKRCLEKNQMNELSKLLTVKGML
ncbi:MAG: YcxB family protein [Xanthomonadales bacterium]|nr:YcxB family protein [Xanthomonadales bacterium]